MKNIMKKAWEIARKGATKFGGSVKSYFAQSLKISWALFKKVSFKSQILLAGKKGNSLFIGIPTNIVTTVTNSFNTVINSVGKVVKDEVEYNLFAITVDVRFSKIAEFNTITNGEHESHKVDLVNRKLY